VRTFYKAGNIRIDLSDTLQEGDFFLKILA